MSFASLPGRRAFALNFTERSPAISSLLHRRLCALLLAAPPLWAQSLTVRLIDPLHPEQPAKPYVVQVDVGPLGIPRGYSLHLRTATCFDGQCKPLDVTLHWDAFGRYTGLEHPPHLPLTKKKHTPFEPRDYERLDEILADENSLLGQHPIEFFVPALAKKPAAGSQAPVAPAQVAGGGNVIGDVDAVSQPTRLAVQDAVVAGAAYSSWVLWHWVNGAIVEQLRHHTMELSTPDFLEQCLLADDSGKVEFGLQALLAATPTKRRCLTAVMRVLETAGRPNCELALEYLQRATSDSHDLALQLVPIYGANAGSTRLLYRFFESLDQAQPVLWERLAARLGALLPYEQLALLHLLRQRAPASLVVRRYVKVLCASDDPIIAARARQFLAAKPPPAVSP